MIEYILPAIKDTNDYLAALSLLKTDAPLTKEEAETLTGLYQKYGLDVDTPGMAKLCIAMDLLPGRTEKDRDDFEALELPPADLNALLLTKNILSGARTLDAETAGLLVEAVQSGNLTRPVDILLARAALDAVVGYVDFSGLREQARALAEFLTGAGQEELDKYSAVMEEARMKCRR